MNNVKSVKQEDMEKLAKLLTLNAPVRIEYSANSLFLSCTISNPDVSSDFLDSFTELLMATHLFQFSTCIQQDNTTFDCKIKQLIFVYNNHISIEKN